MNIGKYKLVIWTITCIFTGVAGSFQAHYHNLATTTFGGIFESIWFLMYAQVGGFQTVYGPLLGAAFFIAFPELFRELVLYSPIIFGAALIVCIFFLPNGMESLFPIARGLRTFSNAEIQRLEEQCHYLN